VKFPAVAGQDHASSGLPDGPYVRNDAGCYEGAEIPVHYDPMISKLVVWGEDRAAALARMRRALDEYRVGGIETNLAFHRRCMRHPAFAAGDFDTGFIARNARELAPAAGEREVHRGGDRGRARRGDQRSAGRRAPVDRPATAEVSGLAPPAAQVARGGALPRGGISDSYARERAGQPRNRPR